VRGAGGRHLPVHHGHVHVRGGAPGEHGRVSGGAGQHAVQGLHALPAARQQQGQARPGAGRQAQVRGHQPRLLHLAGARRRRRESG